MPVGSNHAWGMPSYQDCCADINGRIEGMLLAAKGVK